MTTFARWEPDIGFEGHEPRQSRVGRRDIPWKTMWFRLNEFARDNGILLHDAQVMVCMSYGMTNPAMALYLGFTVDTVKRSVQRLLVRFHADDRTQAVANAFRLDFGKVFKGIPVDGLSP